jgi:23S rRNA maturation mini-RNase III
LVACASLLIPFSNEIKKEKKTLVAIKKQKEINKRWNGMLSRVEEVSFVKRRRNNKFITLRLCIKVDKFSL